MPPLCRFAACLAVLMFLLPACARKTVPTAPAPEPERRVEAEPPRPPDKGWARVDVERMRELTSAMAPTEQGLVSFTELEGPLADNLAYVRRQPADEKALDAEGLSLTWGQLETTLEHLLRVLPRIERDPGILAEHFVWYEMVPQPLMTGYYAPEIEASLEKSAEYPHPLYARPDDLESVGLGEFHPRWEGQRLYYRMTDNGPAPYFDRQAIDLEGALAGRGLEIAWARHAWDIYHLQVQGSGFLRLPDGSTRYVLYDGKNGRQFRSATRIMLEEGLLEPGEVHREGIRQALDRADEDVLELLAENPSYVFFRLADSPPLGTMGTPLTGMVSLATDPEVLPLGSVVPFRAVLPTTPGLPPRPLAGLGLAQDTGGVIKGGRIDYYCGAGYEREYLAFRIKTRVAAFILVSRLALGN